MQEERTGAVDIIKHDVIHSGVKPVETVENAVVLDRSDLCKPSVEEGISTEAVEETVEETAEIPEMLDDDQAISSVSEVLAGEALLAGFDETVTNDAGAEEAAEPETETEIPPEVPQESESPARTEKAEKAETVENPVKPEKTEKTEKTEKISAEQFLQDITTLLQRHPELREGSDPLPQSLVEAYFETGSMETAYLTCLSRRQAGEIQKLENELEILRQNQAAATRAPIRKGVAASASGTGRGEDPMTIGFDTIYW